MSVRYNPCAGTESPALLLFLLFIILNSCVTTPVEKKDNSSTPKSYFLNQGFTLVYNEKLYKERLILLSGYTAINLNHNQKYYFFV